MQGIPCVDDELGAPVFDEGVGGHAVVEAGDVLNTGDGAVEIGGRDGPEVGGLGGHQRLSAKEHAGEGVGRGGRRSWYLLLGS